MKVRGNAAFSRRLALGKVPVASHPRATWRINRLVNPNDVQRETEMRSMTQSEPTTLADRLAEDREFQDSAKRTRLLIQQNIEKSLEQNLSDLNRSDRWMASPWVIFGLGMIAGGALVVLGALFMKFVVLAQ